MKNLHAIRKSKGISQTALSGMTGISRSRICEYDAGKSKGTVENALAIAKALNVTLDELIDAEITIQAPKTNIEMMKTLDIKAMTEFLCENLFCPHTKCKEEYQGNLKGA